LTFVLEKNVVEYVRLVAGEFSGIERVSGNEKLT
jgi:hypothetical protein